MCHGRMASGAEVQLITHVMTFLTPYLPASETDGGAHASATGRRWLTVLALGVVAIILAHMLDVWVWTNVRDPKVYERDWGRMLRSAGYLPTWFIVALGMALHDRGTPDRHTSDRHTPDRHTPDRDTFDQDTSDRGTPGWKWRGGLLALVPTLTGAAAEVLKLLVRRLRPGQASPEYVFRPFSDGLWSNRGMGMPSSHMMVAMGAAVVLARLFPRARWLWYLVAVACGVTRLLAGAHYASDVVVGAVAAYVLGNLLMNWGLRQRTLS